MKTSFHFHFRYRVRPWELHLEAQKTVTNPPRAGVQLGSATLACMALSLQSLSARYDLAEE